MTELLSGQDEVRLWRPSPGPLDATSDAIATEGPGDNGEWESLATARRSSWPCRRSGARAGSCGCTAACVARP